MPKVKNQNLKNGELTREELKLYEDLTENEIYIILEYQKRLPVLQQDNEEWINTRDLHEQLGVSRKYADWIKQQIDDLGLEEKEYFLSKGITSKQGGRPSFDYFTTVETAKEIAMISGAKGGRTNKELKENSKIARKYFIYIEKAFKNRKEWNIDRNETLLKCAKLKETLTKYKDKLQTTIPYWTYGNVYKAEFCLLNEVIIGMSATDYRKMNNLSKNTPIRNTFNEQQLEYVHILEQYDADLINIQLIFDYEQRRTILSRKFNLDIK
jgi:phage anti-repressor protein